MSSKRLPFFPRIAQAVVADPEQDPEIEAMIVCLRALSPLPRETRQRIIRWLADRSDEQVEYKYEE